MGSDVTSYLELADWRRAVARLYAEVRELADADPAAAVTHWRAVREHLYRDHPQSPIPAVSRADFVAHHFPYDPAMRFVAPVLHDDARAATAPTDNASASGLLGGASSGNDAGAGPVALEVPTSTGGAMAFRRIGWVEVPFPAGLRRLALLWMEGYAGGLYLPFRDATNGVETYGAGRYLLDAAKSADLGGDMARGTLVLDFNFAYHPSCAFDPRWSCPLTPPENRLDLPIRAGERLV